MLNNAPAAAPQPPKRLVVIRSGTLPTLQFFAWTSGLPIAEARETLAVMRRSLRAFGANNALHELLKAHGFRWADAVPAAEVTMHDGTHPNCALCEACKRWAVSL